jgi:hypothetical protein
MRRLPKPFNPIDVHSRLVDYHSDLINEFLGVEEQAQHLMFRLSKEALAAAKKAGKVPLVRRSNYENMANDVIFTWEDVFNGDNVEIPVEIARYALAAMVYLDAKEKRETLEPFTWHVEGDSEAIDLSTQSGRDYLFRHYVLAHHRDGFTLEEFEAYVAWVKQNDPDEMKKEGRA